MQEPYLICSFNFKIGETYSLTMYASHIRVLQRHLSDDDLQGLRVAALQNDYDDDGPPFKYNLQLTRSKVIQQLVTYYSKLILFASHTAQCAAKGGRGATLKGTRDCR